MPESSRRTVVEIPWRTLLKVIAAVALAWLLVQLIHIVLLIIVAIVLAVTLEPIVCWFERRGASRAAAATVVAIAIAAAIGGFLWLTWAQLSDQAQFVARRFSELDQNVWDRLPAWIRSSIGSGGDLVSTLQPYVVSIAKSTTYALGVAVLALFLTIYLLIEGRQTYRWIVAFVPKTHRARVEQTAEESTRVIFDYMVGNVITSVIAAVFTLVVLLILKVPAALLLALMAGLLDFVPVVGFLVSLVPAAVLALTVSPTTMVLVLGAYVLYHSIENYLISPWAYGNRMKLSNVAVILAFVVGAQLAGVIGALIALPIAAIYPAIERIWLRNELPSDTEKEHRRLETRRAG